MFEIIHLCRILYKNCWASNRQQSLYQWRMVNLKKKLLSRRISVRATQYIYYQISRKLFLTLFNAKYRWESKIFSKRIVKNAVHFYEKILAEIKENCLFKGRWFIDSLSHQDIFLFKYTYFTLFNIWKKQKSLEYLLYNFLIIENKFFSEFIYNLLHINILNISLFI